MSDCSSTTLPLPQSTVLHLAHRADSTSRSRSIPNPLLNSRRASHSPRSNSYKAALGRQQREQTFKLEQDDDALQKQLRKGARYSPGPKKRQSIPVNDGSGKRWDSISVSSDEEGGGGASDGRMAASRQKGKGKERAEPRKRAKKQQHGSDSDEDGSDGENCLCLRLWLCAD